MKKILLLAALIMMGQTVVFAQKEKAVKETDVPVRYVKDFQNQARDAQNVAWFMALDSSAYTAQFTTPEGDLQAIHFTSKATETRYFIEEKYTPHAIQDTVANHYPKHKINQVYIRNLKGKMTYQVRIAQMKGFLFWKKEANVKILSFETNGKMIEAIDEL
ncbi:MAG: hypothetical protein MJZ86_09320 [Bacteroidales bacterium]|nr:hypothetical protein [Bacteroidales bacterium]